MKAVVATLKEFDGKHPCMGNVYIIMRTLQHHVAALRALRKREAMVASDLHYVGALLNPHFI
jgi:hypothetical protein